MQRCVQASRTFLVCRDGPLGQRCFGRVPIIRRCRIATVQRPLLDAEHTTRTRHLLRHIFREITYLPDPHARQWYKKYTIGRFREYGFRVWEHRHDAEYEDRIHSQLREARHMHNFLHRATHGETKPLLKVLLTTYGRQGKRRHELLSALRQGSESAWEAYVPAFSPALDALLNSQIANPPPHLTRPLLRRMHPRIEELNAWLRPMPKCRVKNQVKAWYAAVLDRVHPPLPRFEWERLRDLATGKAHESIPRRRAGRRVETVSALDMVIAYGKPSIPKLHDAHKITPRFMQRLWAKVFEQCPVMDWDGARQQWIVIWGGQVLYRLHLGNGRPTQSATRIDRVKEESAASIVES
ncbi:hypothetical protein EJ03DRAFT_267562 [Teratosphaeria nubilosa]|uniref:LYR motif-containing protein Cup1-like N-terminal domain-containing protein n=1 Tax=Teratosphaeria nubilosa TaxID=161662 RepID=A0A6G1LGW9_9PEZI|nr:hypothetical protein EJ03DRAFT_267562 [Teratosphaeria nubilosa]